jgi:hypothetical protein
MRYRADMDIDKAIDYVMSDGREGLIATKPGIVDEQGQGLIASNARGNVRDNACIGQITTDDLGIRAGITLQSFCENLETVTPARHQHKIMAFTC